MQYREVPGEAGYGDGDSSPFSVPIVTDQQSVSQRYDRVLHAGAAEFVALRDELVDLEERVGPGLTRLYDRRPYLRPDTLRFMRDADEMYLGYISTDAAVDVVLPTAEQQVTRLMDSASIPRATIGWGEMPVALAAASVRRDDTHDSYKMYRSMVANRGVREVAARHLQDNIGLFEAGSVAGLDAHHLERYGLSTYDISACDRMAHFVTRAITDLPRLDAPPLHLTQLAADVISFNADSVLPVRSKLLMRQPSPVELAASAVTLGYEKYLRDKYNYVGIPDDRLRGILAESDLAERQGFLDANDKQQFRTVNRTRKIFDRVKESDRLPPAVQTIVSHSRHIIRSSQA